MRRSLSRLIVLVAMLVLTAWVPSEALPGYCHDVCFVGPGQLSTLCICRGTTQIVRCGNYWLGQCPPFGNEP